jgi:hypothetical protein
MLQSVARCSRLWLDAPDCGEMLHTMGRCCILWLDAPDCCEMLHTVTRCSILWGDAVFCDEMLQSVARCSRLWRDAPYCDEMLQSVARCSRLWRDAPYCDEMLQSVARCSRLWRDAPDCGEMLHTVERCCSLWRDAPDCGEMLQTMAICSFCWGNINHREIHHVFGHPCFEWSANQTRALNPLSWKELNEIATCSRDVKTWHTVWKLRSVMNAFLLTWMWKVPNRSAKGASLRIQCKFQLLLFRAETTEQIWRSLCLLLRSSRYNGSLVTQTAVSLTAAKCNSFIFTCILEVQCFCKSRHFTTDYISFFFS